MIDILRASSTICTAFAHGAAQVIPCEQVEQAHQYRDQLSEVTTVLGGERSGVLIEGFDLGNSPAEYTEEIVSGKTVLFTTTNGTKAIHRCHEAEEVFIGSFLNLSAVVQAAISRAVPVHLICAGTDQEITLEDCLFAGAVAEKLMSYHPERTIDCDDATSLCLSLYRPIADSTDQQTEIMNVFASSQGGQNLQRISMESDFSVCAQIDLLKVIPSWNKETNCITGDTA